VKTILIVDRDLGFVLWLGHILNKSGSVALPATTIAEAAEMVSLLGVRVDVLITAPGGEGVREFVEELRLASPDLQLVGVGSEEDSPRAMPFPETVWKRRPQGGDEATKWEWVTLIREMAASGLSLAFHN
jgi:hypothetical protein